MSAERAVLGLALFVTVVMVLGSLGFTAGALGAPTGSPSAARSSPSAAGLPDGASSSPPTNLPALLSSTPARSASTLTGSPAPPVTPGALPSPSGRMSAALAELHTLHIPLKYAFLPNLNANPNPTLVGGHITPGYSSAPAPLGVAEYGLRNVSGTITPYTLSTASVEGIFAPYSMNGLSQDISGPDEYGVQLNSVLNNVTLQGTTGYEFWTQNVIEYSVYSHQLFFVSNIWNFSSASGTIEPNDFFQIGPNASVGAPSYYYGLGGPITVTYPFTLDLYLNSTLVGGRDAVYFNFSLQNGTEFFAGSYDHAIFNSTVSGGPAAPAPVYVADGSAYDPIGLPNDFEMVLGGPGGGSNFDVFKSQAYFGLQFWNASAGAYSTVPSAYGYGSETGETSTGAYVLWGGPGFSGVGNPSAYLANGPSFLQGLWNVSSAPEALLTYGGFIDLSVAPSNAFVFIAPGSVFTGWYTTNWSLFQWAPYSLANYYFEVDPGTYTIVAVLANYDPAETTVNVVAAGGNYPALISMASDAAQGVYTPLWAFNNFDLQNISNPVSGGALLYNQQYGPVGFAASTSVTFPWFGAVNDYLFPVFPGIFLYNTTNTALVFSPPSFQVNYPTALAAQLAANGIPTWNDLQMIFYNSSSIQLAHASSIGGWWYAGSYFGPAASAYNVVFWNVTSSVVDANTFDTGGNALYFYGGTENLIANNTFEDSVPVSGNPSATVAGAYGSVGIFEADYGNATAVAFALHQANETYACVVGLGYCDLIFNNIFLTSITADSPSYDPYYFYTAYPQCPAWLGLGPITCAFDNSWNVLPGAVSWSSNIIGGPMLGGNYWWDYGSPFNPYSQIPYIAGADSTFLSLGGDYLPLTPYTLYHIQFVETGLPPGTAWAATTLISGVYNFVVSYNTMANLTAPSGSYTYSFVTFDGLYGAPSGTLTVVDHSVVVHVTFVKADTIQFTESGLTTGSQWWVSLFNFTTHAFLGEVYTTGTSVNYTGLLPAEYTWQAWTTAAWRTAQPMRGTVDLSGNVTVAIQYAPFYALTAVEAGLPVGSTWTLVVWNSTETVTTSTVQVNQSVDVNPGAYNWIALSSGYEAIPNQGTVSVSANATLNVDFAVAATLTFTETGLPSGAAWTVSLVQNGVTVNTTGTGASIVFAAIVGAYNYSVTSTGFTPAPATGSGTLPANTPVAVTFTAGAPKTGSLSLTVTPAGAAATVNGAAVTLPFSQPEAPGLYAIVVSESGYTTYYNNVSVVSGQTTHLAVSLTASSSSSGTTAGTGGISTTGWVLIALLGVLALVFLVTTLLFARRGRSPPPPLTSPPPMVGGETPPAPGTPAWSEGPAPSSGPPPGAI